MKKKTYLLKSTPEFFAELDAAVIEADCTRADFIRDAVMTKLKHHKAVMKPFFEDMKNQKDALEDDMPIMPRISSPSDFYF
jgi:hypothetical protein